MPCLVTDVQSRDLTLESPAFLIQFEMVGRSFRNANQVTIDGLPLSIRT